MPPLQGKAPWPNERWPGQRNPWPCGQPGPGLVASGDLFGFSIDGSDGCCGNGNATISNFNGPIASVPGPLPILGVGAAFAYSRRLRRRINLAKSPVNTDSVVAEQL